VFTPRNALQPRRIFAGAAVLALLAACGGSAGNGGGGGGGGGGTGGSTTPTCLDASGQPTTSCAVTPSANTCAMGDANHCVPLVKLEVEAGSTESGPCLHLVYDNQCASEIFADTCIQYQDAAGTTWQCWTSSTPSGATIDLGQCQATGKYFFVSTASSGQLDIDEQQCSAPG
jgi:hypothetical protein